MTSGDQLDQCLLEAHLPSLIMALVHLTGETRYLGPDFKLTYGNFDDGQGGLPPEKQAEIRLTARAAILAYLNGQPLPPAPNAETVQRMMNCLAGQSIPANYLPFLLEELALDEQDTRFPKPIPPEPGSPKHVLIIGAGMSGLLAAIRFKQAGLSFEIVEKNYEVGGTWLENAYPGCRVDSPNLLYSYSFEADYEWPLRYSTQAILLDYFRWIADKYDLRRHITFNTSVIEAVLDETELKWDVRLRDQTGAERIVRADAVISAVGQLNQPYLPDIPGRETFSGPALHSARWQPEVSLEGKRVAVIGTGASAYQIVPVIAPQAKELLLFQRTPPWPLPAPTYHDAVGAGQQWLLKNIPFYARWYRLFLFWMKTDGHYPLVQADPEWRGGPESISAANAEVGAQLADYIRSQLGSRTDLLPYVIPKYPYGGKRALSDNGIWFATLKQDNVHLVTEGIREITPSSLITADGREHPVDVIVYATGFRASDFLATIRVVGRDNVELHERWQGEARAYLGMTIPGFPNLFCLYGPNTNLVVNGSLIFFVECSVRYVLSCFNLLAEAQAAALEPRADVHDTYNERIDAANRQMAWGVPQVSNWYKSASGRVSQNWPFPVVEYWQQTLEPNPADFVFLKHPGGQS